MKNALIILDRDGVLNKLLIRPNGSTDSPMTTNEIEIFPWVSEQLKILSQLKYGLIIATNQPAAAKGKISQSELINIHFEIELRSGVFLAPCICLHRAEDNCECRKPKTGLLEEAFRKYSSFNKKYSWMVGDRATDVIAGHNFGLKTALLGPSVIRDMDILKEKNILPTFHGKDLRDFVEHIMAYHDIL
jgi:D-glycero-D-manno-heptose 1,7-bisphosphate phosphatase